MIIPGSWILSLIISIPHFLKTDFDTELATYQCTYEWPEQWMNTAYTWATNAFVLLSIVLMTGLYTRVVYTLWFKRNDDCRLTYQQQVCDSFISWGFNVLRVWMPLRILLHGLLRRHRHDTSVRLNRKVVNLSLRRAPLWHTNQAILSAKCYLTLF